MFGLPLGVTCAVALDPLSRTRAGLLWPSATSGQDGLKSGPSSRPERGDSTRPLMPGQDAAPDPPASMDTGHQGPQRSIPQRPFTRMKGDGREGFRAGRKMTAGHLVLETGP